MGRILPTSPPWFLSLLADAYREIGELDRSIATAETGIEKFPRNIDARLILCSDYGLAGKDDQARNTAQEIMDIQPAFSIAGYLENQQYRHKDETTERRFVESLRKAGLPE